MLCGQKWYQKHKDDYTEDDIAALGIEISMGGKKYPQILQGDRKGKVGELFKIIRAGKYSSEKA